MVKSRQIIPLVLFSGLLALVVIALRPRLSAAQNWETKSDIQAAVTVEVVPIVLKSRENPKFNVSFSTHSVELDFNVEDAVSLVDDQGNIVASPKWVGSAPGGHHRSGKLDFSGSLEQNVKSVTLTFKNIAGVPGRVFNWNLL